MIELMAIFCKPSTAGWTFRTSSQFLFLAFLICRVSINRCIGWISTTPSHSSRLQHDRRLLSNPPITANPTFRLVSRRGKEDDGNDRSVQDDLLHQLDSAFNYEGRLPSKLTAVGNENRTTTSELTSISTEHHDIPQRLFRCGFVSIIGAANMGKSTLLNALLEEELCIATRRPQTTRHAILGILSTDYSQVCLLDTPGVLDEPAAYKLQECMMEAVKGAVNSADILLVVTDMFSTPLPDYDALFQKVQNSRKPVIVAINKIDLVGRVSETKSSMESSSDLKDVDENSIEKTYSIPEAVAKWRKLLPRALAIIPLVASSEKTAELSSTDTIPEQHPGVHLLRQILVGGEDIAASIRALGRPIPGMFQPGVKFLSDEDVRTLLPLGPPLYDEESLSDRSERFFVSELIRESLFECLKKELPYSCEVQVTDFKEPRGASPLEKTRIHATIFVERDSQKMIVVGKGGSKIKEIGILAREKIELFLGDGQINLSLQVAVKKNWRKNDDKLKEFGYQAT